MKFQLEKETCWENGKSVTRYWAKVNDCVVDVAYDEEKAYQMYENVKVNYVSPGREILKEEEI